MRCLYVDLDGTLLGPRGSLLRGGDGRFSLDAVRALQACDRAGVEVVPYSGRRQGSVLECARLIGASAFVFEVGCGLVVDGELEWLTGGVEPSPQAGSIFEQIEASGAPALLLERFAGRLEYHTPWSLGREVSHLFRGCVDVAEAQAVLREAGFCWLRLVDNGVVRAAGEAWPVREGVRTVGQDVRAVGEVARTGGQAGAGGAEVRTEGAAAREDAGGATAAGRVHAYHLIPAAASKARAVARHMQARGYSPADCVAVGDSREDLGVSEAVGSLWLVANALERDPSLRAELTGRRGVHVASGAYGAGVYEAVVSTLADRR